MSSRRPSISIHDYPEHLNPFKEASPSVPSQIFKEKKSTEKETKTKFWTFGRGRKKRSHSFSIKNTWNGLFGKCKEPEAPERRSMINTVSTMYKRDTINGGPNGRPVVQPRISRDQQEFDEALGTLARRRKYTLDNGSRYNSSLTVNGDPARIYDGSPQETTTSIMGDLTPKPPARKFGQVSPRVSDQIPTLDFDGKERLSNGELFPEDREHDRAPVAPRRSGLRSSQRFLPSDVAVRRSNLSINSCMSISSTASGRKKRRAPQPPRLKDSVEIAEESNISLSKTTELESPTTPIEISRVAEDITELTKKSQQIEEQSLQKSSPSPEDSKLEILKEAEVKIPEIKNSKDLPKDSEVETSPSVKPESEESAKLEREETPEKVTVEIEFRREADSPLEIFKEITPPEDLKKKKSPAISRSNSFCVKEEIEKIEKQIKELESKNLVRRHSEDSTDRNSYNARLSIQENRRHFFQDLVDNPEGVKVELKELPREQKDIHIIRLTDPPVPVEAPKESVKVIELHISEPIRQWPEVVLDNPLPKPRRGSALGLERKPSIRDLDQEDPHPKGSSL
ncbi:protein piccolo-like isoform X2 [Belonocnema kinseyi]|uniref:protein piccolo-like isoform X2 n=1 Tax=Belonocnema kinseyi TaxID=2817044 RepID=UPI00143D5BED|nr:protein piccolo-like isoform X2 [Belonocnema kinseyi]